MGKENLLTAGEAYQIALEASRIPIENILDSILRAAKGGSYSVKLVYLEKENKEKLEELGYRIQLVEPSEDLPISSYKIGW